MRPIRTLRTASAIVGVAGSVLLGSSPPAVAQGAEPAGAPGCTATGYFPESPEELARLRLSMVDNVVPDVDGFPLDGDTQAVSDREMPLIVIVEYIEPLPGGSMDVAALGVTTGGPWLEYAGRVENPRNYMEDVALEELGLGVVGSMGLRVESGPCTGETVLRLDRAPLFTPVGAVSAGLLTLFGLLAVWVARRRRGGWVRRFLFAAPLGVVAAFWLAVALYEVGVLSPFVAFPWWLLAVGVLLAALTPLTRRRSEDAHPAPVPGSGG